jgi:hypothetical protein
MYSLDMLLPSQVLFDGRQREELPPLKLGFTPRMQISRRIDCGSGGRSSSSAGGGDGVSCRDGPDEDFFDGCGQA